MKTPSSSLRLLKGDILMLDSDTCGSAPDLREPHIPLRKWVEKVRIARKHCASKPTCKGMKLDAEIEAIKGMRAMSTFLASPHLVKGAILELNPSKSLGSVITTMTTPTQ